MVDEIMLLHKQQNTLVNYNDNELSFNVIKNFSYPPNPYKSVPLAKQEVNKQHIKDMIQQFKGSFMGKILIMCFQKG